MDSKEESLKLQSEFKDCQKVLTAIGDENQAAFDCPYDNGKMQWCKSG